MKPQTERSLRLLVRTPREVLMDLRVTALSVAGRHGTVRISAGCRPVMSAVEPGLVRLRAADGSEGVIVSGWGTLTCDGREARLVLSHAELASGTDFALTG